MVKYSFTLTVKDTKEQYTYALDLNYQQEISPEDIFIPQVRENLRNALQTQSQCAIRNNHLNHIIQTWIQDIKEGFRNSGLTLSLPLLSEVDMEDLHEPGYQDLPVIIPPNLSKLEPEMGMLPPLNFC